MVHRRSVLGALRRRPAVFIPLLRYRDRYFVIEVPQVAQELVIQQTAEHDALKFFAQVEQAVEQPKEEVTSVSAFVKPQSVDVRAAEKHNDYKEVYEQFGKCPKLCVHEDPTGDQEAIHIEKTFMRARITQAEKKKIGDVVSEATEKKERLQAADLIAQAVEKVEKVEKAEAENIIYCETAAASAQKAVTDAQKLADAQQFSDGPSEMCTKELLALQKKLDTDAAKFADLKKDTAERKCKAQVQSSGEEITSVEEAVQRLANTMIKFDDSKLTEISEDEAKSVTEEIAQIEHEAQIAVTDARKFEADNNKQDFHEQGLTRAVPPSDKQTADAHTPPQLKRVRFAVEPAAEDLCGTITGWCEHAGDGGTAQGFLEFLTCEDILAMQAVSHHHFDIVAGEEEHSSGEEDNDGNSGAEGEAGFDSDDSDYLDWVMTEYEKGVQRHSD